MTQPTPPSDRTLEDALDEFQTTFQQALNDSTVSITSQPSDPVRGTHLKVESGAKNTIVRLPDFRSVQRKSGNFS